MLSYELSRNHSGLLLVGDYTSLRWLHDIVHDVSDRSPLLVGENDRGDFLGFAYCIRVAYEGRDEVRRPPPYAAEVGTRYGAKLLWPVVLLHQRIVRVSLGYFDHSARHQAAAYALEAVIEEALKEDFGSKSPTIVDRWQRLDPRCSDSLARLRSRTALFCSWAGAERKRRLAALLHSFDPVFDGVSSVPRGMEQRDVVVPGELAPWEGEDVQCLDPGW